MSNWLSATEIRAGIESGLFSAESIVQKTLDDIASRDGDIGAFLQVFSDRALEQARAIDALKKEGKPLPRLAGIPVAIKDNMLLAHETASAGSKMLKEYKATYTGTAVARLETAGAIIIGRTNMDEFAMGSSTETSAYRLTHNPWDLTRVPGGSSGGAAAAVAAGFVPVSLGSDTGGSIRQPAALCGIVGLKPTYGRVSRYGLIAMSSSLDQIGPFARTVEDAALILSVMEGKDEKDATSLEVTESAAPEMLSPSFEGLRIGVPSQYFIDGMDEEVRKAVEDAIAVFKDHGAIVKEISLPLTDAALPAYYILQPAEVSSNMGRYDGMRYGTRAPGSLEESYLTARGEGFGPEVKRRIMLGTYILSAGYYDAYYKKALAVRQALRMEFDAAFKDVDLILGPTSPAVAWKLGERFNDPIAMYLADIFTTAANIAGIPGISIPCGFAHGLPVGLQLQAPFMQDVHLLRAAAAYQKVTDWHLKTAPEV